MNKTITYLLWALVLFGACDVDGNLFDQCCNKVTLSFRYYTNPTKEDYQRIASQDHFLFCDSILVGTAHINGVARGQGLLDQRNNMSLRQMSIALPDGHYSLISWSNVVDGGASELASMQMGISTLNNLLLTHTDNPIPYSAATYKSNTERVYYARCDFDVIDGKGSTHVVDMLCAHTQLKFVARWANTSESPNMTYPIYFRLSGVPMAYLPTASHSLQMLVVGTPLYGQSQIIEQVPACTPDRVTVQQRAVVQTNTEITTTLVTYRLWDHDATHPILSIWGGPDGQTRLMKDVDLRRFFETNGWALTNNTQQYLNILLVLDGDRVEVSPLDDKGWTDGGSFGAKP